jgi:hypothetical protein
MGGKKRAEVNLENRKAGIGKMTGKSHQWIIVHGIENLNPGMVIASPCPSFSDFLFSRFKIPRIRP